MPEDRGLVRGRDKTRRLKVKENQMLSLIAFILSTIGYSFLNYKSPPQYLKEFQEKQENKKKRNYKKIVSFFGKRLQFQLLSVQASIIP
ncbi:hypothetical protein [Desulfurella sp.]|uniref:hypothetical protein n=1 Tax=Desulfurella sp. TaxID=1962857 RepID=UPI00257B33D4|nr:hypothetical protein [Desulfurella sp.]